MKRTRPTKGRTDPPERRRKPAVRGGKVKTRTPTKGRLRAFYVNEGLPTPAEVMAEIQDMTDVLMGRDDPPMDAGYLTLMEVADAYFARACELENLIYAGLRDGHLLPRSALAKMRTQEIRTFKEMSKKAAELGSRRLTDEQLRYEMEQHGRESSGGI